MDNQCSLFVPTSNDEAASWRWHQVGVESGCFVIDHPLNGGADGHQVVDGAAGVER